MRPGSGLQHIWAGHKETYAKWLKISVSDLDSDLGPNHSAWSNMGGQVGTVLVRGYAGNDFCATKTHSEKNVTRYMMSLDDAQADHLVSRVTPNYLLFASGFTPASWSRFGPPPTTGASSATLPISGGASFAVSPWPLRWRAVALPTGRWCGLSFPRLMARASRVRSRPRWPSPNGSSTWSAWRYA